MPHTRGGFLSGNPLIVHQSSGFVWRFSFSTYFRHVRKLNNKILLVRARFLNPFRPFSFLKSCLKMLRGTFYTLVNEELGDKLKFMFSPDVILYG